ncbi:MAG TPA: glycoside hydrolase family 3 N-terminal domain-containing protein [Acidobacteriota bacterium]|nr:glycoside hydrolase family 3 N-terminal domain-containing protein [Acidobacteriota bacterium]HNT17285.1 glycoside hydrolase family 3 N-terminal domain-containing protein [Acidobacteriota bacterium]
MIPCGRLPIWVTIDGYSPDEKLERFLRETVPFGVILFARHIKSQKQVSELTEAIRSWSPGTVRIALDQEGGRVSRLRELGYEFRSAESCAGDPWKARSTASEMAAALSELGFDVDFAPVVDLGPAEQGTGLETRLYSSDDTVVVQCARAFLEALKEREIAGCLKHFPGLGGSKVDSHRKLPVISGDPSEREAHLRPYRELDAEFVMVAHASYEFLEDPSPSTLTPRTYELLRKIGFGGTIVTDDLTMGALSEYGPLERLAGKSLECGADIALFVSSEDETRRAADYLRCRHGGC